MTSDEHKGITVTYNYLNLPEKVAKADGSSIQWLYDAAGNKLQKTVVATNLAVNDNPILSKEYKAAQIITSTGTIVSGSNVIFTAGQKIELNDGFSSADYFLARIQPNTATEVRDYLGGIEYLNSTIEAVYFSGGRVKYDGSNTEYEYVLGDYQGNTRVLFKNNGGTAEVVEDYSGYYPFGAMHQQQGDYSQKYLFGGKELQTELDLGWSDFGTRCLDNWSGKWLGIDILAEAKMGISPYAYGLGNPVRFSDPTGMIEEDENGIASVSTDLWGSSRGESFINEQTAKAKGKAGQTQAKQASSSDSGGSGGVGLQADSYQSNALSSKFSSLFGMFSGGGDDETEEESGQEGKPWARSVADWVPFLGSGLGFYDAYQAGDYWGMAFYGAMFVSDAFLAGAIVKGIAKGGIKAFSKNYKTWSGWRSFYGPKPKGTGFAAKGQELHHWRWKRNGATSGSGLAWKLKNQMWNLKGMPKDLRFHQAIHGKGDFKQFKTLITLHYAVPNWVKAGGLSIGGRLYDNY